MTHIKLAPVTIINVMLFMFIGSEPSIKLESLQATGNNYANK